MPRIPLGTDNHAVPEGVEPGEHVVSDQRRSAANIAVKVSGKTAGRNGTKAKVAIPIEQQRAMKKRGMYLGNHRDVRPRRDPYEVDMPVDPENRDTLIADETRKTDDIQLNHAPHPPPGYRYNLSGKLVPLIESRVPLTDPRGQQIFLEILELTGSARAGLDACGIYALDTLQNQLSKDKNFEQMYDAAMDRHRDVLYAAAYQRAVHGYEVPLVGGQFKDEIIGHERRYSDSIAILMLKRHFPEFRDAAGGGPKVVVNANDNRKVISVEGVDMTKLNKTQRDHLRAFLGSMEGAPIPEVTPTQQIVIDVPTEAEDDNVDE